MAATQSMPFTTPVGRIVQGDCYNVQLNDQKGVPRVFKSGAKIGQPAPQQFIVLAVPKLVNGVENPDYQAWYSQVHAVASQAWPQFFANGQCTNPNFAWKVRDGDGVDTQGQPLASKTGFAGHWIISLTRNVGEIGPIQTVQNVNGAYVNTTADKPVRPGNWVRVAGSVRGNDSLQTPGLYMNVDMVEFVGCDPSGEITYGPDASKAFGTPAFVMPSHISTTPLTPVAAPLPVAPVTHVAVQLPVAPVAAPLPVAPVAAPLPVAPVAPPYAGFMPQAKVMLPAAGSFTYEQYLATGWTDEMLITQGFMAG
jgi:hypothetical protein